MGRCGERARDSGAKAVKLARRGAWQEPCLRALEARVGVCMPFCGGGGEESRVVASGACPKERWMSRGGACQLQADGGVAPHQTVVR